MARDLAVGIDVGGTNLKAALVDRSGRLLARRVAEADAAAGPKRLVERCCGLVDELAAEQGGSRDRLLGAGLGAPGPLSAARGVIIHAANLPGWCDVPLQHDMEVALNMPVLLENDGNAAAFGEYWSGVGQRRFDLVMFTLGTGVGAGVVLGGEVLRGHFENAAELGHTIVDIDGLPCSCGKRGCLEQYSSASALARRVTTAIQTGEASILADRIKSDSPINSEQIIEAAREGDSLCQRMVDEACRYLAVACINVQHTFNPAKIVLGGGLARAGAGLVERVRLAVKQMQWKLLDDCPEITLGSLGYDAGMIGAACLAWEKWGGGQRGEATVGHE